MCVFSKKNLSIVNKICYFALSIVRTLSSDV